MSQPLPNRRQSDAQIEGLREFIEQTLDGKLDEHRDVDHLKIDREKAQQLIDSAPKRQQEHEQLLIDSNRNHAEVSKLLDYVAGEKVLDEFTDQWFGERAGGLIQEVSELRSDFAVIKKQAENGGVRTRVTSRDKVIIALFASAGPVLVALISAYGG